MNNDINKELQELSKRYILEYELYLEKTENNLNNADKDIIEIKNDMLNLLLSGITIDEEGNLNMTSVINEESNENKNKPFFKMIF